MHPSTKQIVQTKYNEKKSLHLTKPLHQRRNIQLTQLLYIPNPSELQREIIQLSTCIHQLYQHHHPIINDRIFDMNLQSQTVVSREYMIKHNVKKIVIEDVSPLSPGIVHAFNSQHNSQFDDDDSCYHINSTKETMRKMKDGKSTSGSRSSNNNNNNKDVNAAQHVDEQGDEYFLVHHLLYQQQQQQQQQQVKDGSDTNHNSSNNNNNNNKHYSKPIASLCTPRMTDRQKKSFLNNRKHILRMSFEKKRKRVSVGSDDVNDYYHVMQVNSSSPLPPLPPSSSSSSSFSSLLLHTITMEEEKQGSCGSCSTTEVAPSASSSSRSSTSPPMKKRLVSLKEQEE